MAKTKPSKNKKMNSRSTRSKKQSRLSRAMALFHRATNSPLRALVFAVLLGAVGAGALLLTHADTPSPYACPVSGHPGWTANGYYGAPRSGHQHAGIDLAQNYGAPIFAAQNGTVHYPSRPDPGGYGNYIWLTADDGSNTTLYGHLGNNNGDGGYSVGNGAHVAAGQQIGRAGNSGNSEGFSHLHWEVHRGYTEIAGYGTANSVNPQNIYNGCGAPAPPPPLTWYLKNSNFSDSNNFSMQYGQRGDIPVPCDWDGNGSTSAAVFRNGTFYITNHNRTGGAEYYVAFGQRGDIPVCGDWDGNGTQTPGVYRNGAFYLTNSTCQNCAAPTNIAMAFGQGGDIPVVGRWIKGNHTDWPGIKRGYQYMQRYSWANGPVQNQFYYGNSSDKPIVGDWDGDGAETIGVVRGNQFFLSNNNSATAGSFNFGNNSDTPISGSWGGGAYTMTGMVR
jgi:murein DD-endopeptidase MepM/ murein hydrolase activator NlpD